MKRALRGATVAALVALTCAPAAHAGGSTADAKFGELTVRAKHAGDFREAGARVRTHGLDEKQHELHEHALVVKYKAPGARCPAKPTNPDDHWKLKGYGDFNTFVEAVDVNGAPPSASRDDRVEMCVWITAVADTDDIWAPAIRRVELGPVGRTIDLRSKSERATTAPPAVKEFVLIAVVVLALIAIIARGGRHAERARPAAPPSPVSPPQPPHPAGGSSPRARRGPATLDWNVGPVDGGHQISSSDFAATRTRPRTRSRDRVRRPSDPAKLFRGSLGERKVARCLDALVAAHAGTDADLDLHHSLALAYSNGHVGDIDHVLAVTPAAGDPRGPFIIAIETKAEQPRDEHFDQIAKAAPKASRDYFAHAPQYRLVVHPNSHEPVTYDQARQVSRMGLSRLEPHLKRLLSDPATAYQLAPATSR